MWYPLVSNSIQWWPLMVWVERIEVCVWERRQHLLWCVWPESLGQVGLDQVLVTRSFWFLKNKWDRPISVGFQSGRLWPPYLAACTSESPGTLSKMHFPRSYSKFRQILVGKNQDLESTNFRVQWSLGCISVPTPLLVAWPWAGHLTSSNHSFFVGREQIILPICRGLGWIRWNNAHKIPTSLPSP